MGFTITKTYAKMFFLLKETNVVYTYDWWAKKIYKNPVLNSNSTLPVGFSFV